MHILYQNILAVMKWKRNGCRGVIEYGSDIIRFDTGSKITVFKGRGLTITEFERNRAEICGIFSSVEFE